MSFGSDIRKWAEKSKVGVDEVIRASILDVTTSVIKRTPVGNPSLWKSKPPVGYVGGQARGNWFASINAPTTKSTKAIDKDGTATILNAQKAIEDAPGNILYITNNLPYIFRLEYQGWSTQAPVGMVRVSVLEFNNALSKAIAEL